MSFAAHDGRKRQSAHDANKVPAASIASEGSEIARSGSLSADVSAATVARVNVAPPSVERKLSIVPVSALCPW